MRPPLSLMSLAVGGRIVAPTPLSVFDATGGYLEGKCRPNTLGRRGGGCYSQTMTSQPIAQILPRKKPRPQWIVPLVTALVFLAVIMVLYQPA